LRQGLSRSSIPTREARRAVSSTSKGSTRQSLRATALPWRDRNLHYERFVIRLYYCIG
jgi:hypothetical protein